MGLQTKRRIAEYKEELFPYFAKRLKDDSKIDISFDADWNSFDDEALNIFENQGLTYITHALSKICADKVGKEAFAEKGVKKVYFRNNPDKSKNSAKILNDTIELNGAWGISSYLHEDEIQKQLENQL